MENLNMHFYDGNKSLAYHEYVERERMPSNNIYEKDSPDNPSLPITCFHFLDIYFFEEISPANRNAPDSPETNFTV